MAVGLHRGFWVFRNGFEFQQCTARKMHRAGASCLAGRSRMLWRLLSLVLVLTWFYGGPAYGQDDSSRDLPRLRAEVRNARQAIDKLEDRADQVQVQIEQSASSVDTLGSAQQKI